jgi:hypothetical protein
VPPAGEDPALESLRFPLGRFAPEPSYSAADVTECLGRLALAPKRLAVAVRGLTPAQLDTPYRPGGWSARQVVHHLADSLAQASARFRWSLTQEEPVVPAFDEGAWSALPDARRGPLAPSLAIFEGTSARLVALLRTLRREDWARRFVHPEAQRPWRLDEAAALYAWHHEHHVAQIGSLRARAGWRG